MTEAVWVLADPRAGTAAQALGIGERLGVPFRAIGLEYDALARVPWPWPTLVGLTPAARRDVKPPWPRLVIAAGRRAAPVARWLGRRGAHTVHAMRPGFGAAAFDLLVVGRHDSPAAAPHLIEILGATHRLTPALLVAARQAWAAEFGSIPAPRVALLVGGPVRGVGLPPDFAALLAEGAMRFGGSVLATTSRRTGEAATAALAAALAGVPHRLHRWGEGGANPYAGLLAWADAIVVTGDSVSMVSEALTTAVPVFVAISGDLGPRHRALMAALRQAGQVRPIEAAPTLFARSPLDETGRVVAAIRARGLAG